MAKPDYAEFDNPKLAKIYDSFNALTEDETFWLKKIKELGIRSVIDFGCGTGLLTCKLADLEYETVGIEPAQAMMNLAKQKPYADKIKWLPGSTEQLEGQKSDLVIMTSHVTQFFLNDEKWENLLQHIHASLNEGGYIFFDTKNPLSKPWERWSKEETRQIKSTPEGDVEFWIDAPMMDDNQVEYELYYLFLKDQTKLVSKNRLVYRSKDVLEEQLGRAGFEIEKVYGGWDGGDFKEQDNEMIFLARKV